MTTLKLSPNASGAGSFTIAAPSTSSTLTLNLPSTLGTNNGSALVSTDASGNLGLGVTPSSWGSGRRILQMPNGAAFGDYSGFTGLSQNYYQDGSQDRYIANGFAARYLQGNGQHLWYTAPSGTAGNAISFTQAMTLDASSVLSINNGTSNAAKFRVYRSTSDQNYLELRTNGGDSVIVANGITGANGSLVFARDANTGGFTESARIDSSGNLLVGATGTGSFFDGKLNVYGSGSQPAACFKNDGTGGQFTTSHWNTATSGTRTFTKFVLGSTPTEVGSISSTGTSTTYATSSDYRLKENIQPMTGALAVVQQLKPCTYNWKADGSDGQGFIAHELQEVVPDCVTGEKDAVETYTDEDGVEQTRPVYQGIDTSFLVATLTAAIQEQQAIINAQSAALEQLKAQLTSVSEDVAALKGAK